MNGKLFFIASLAAMQGVSLMAQQDELQYLTAEDLAGITTKSRSYARQSVHDPSIVTDTLTNPNKCTYYVFGSHVAGAKTTDLCNWQWFGAGESSNTSNSWFGKMVNGSPVRCKFSEAYDTHTVTKVLNCNGEEVNFGNFNAHEWQYTGYNIAGNEWAPDVIYNPTMGKWLMYMSVNGDHWASVIVCLASDNVDGPYVYQGPVVFSGFQGNYDHVGFTKTADYKHTDLEIALGTQTSLPARYACGSSWGSYWPNCIDPCVFFDDNGNLQMSYGSWSGGIFMLQLDKNTGLRDYTHTYPYMVSGKEATPGAANANCTQDPYFGTKIAGGYYCSGEASYIEKIGKYYFLFLSYGGLEAKGGYQMRIFRSEKFDGPYVDCAGNSALFSKYELNYGSNAASNRGVLLMGGYQWPDMPNAEVAQGHNSAGPDANGRHMVFYHTRTNDGTEGHSVRVHQLFLNQDGWLVASPYETNDEAIVTQHDIETKQMFSESQVAGQWQFIRHTYRQNTSLPAFRTPESVSLNADGTVSGAYKGSWALTPGTSFITVTLDDVEYKGVLSAQVVDYTNIPAVCISALSSSSGTFTNNAANTRGVEIWGSKIDAKVALAKANASPTGVIDGLTTSVDFSPISSFGYGVVAQWTSSNEDVMTADGKVGKDGDAKLSLSLIKDGFAIAKEYNVKVASAEPEIEHPVCGGTEPTADFFTQFSDNYEIKAGSSRRFQFYNYNDQRQNYHNFLVVCSSIAQGQPGYSAKCEYLVARPDKNAWGSHFNGNPTTTLTGFMYMLNGAFVDLVVSFNGSQISIEGTITGTSGKVYDYKCTSLPGIDAKSINVFFTVEKAFLTAESLDASDAVDVVRDNNDKQEAKSYDIMGRPVGRGYKGLVVEDHNLKIVK